MSRKKQKVKRDSRLHLRLFPQEVDLIKMVARENDTTMSDLIRTGINVVLHDPEIYLKKEG